MTRPADISARLLAHTVASLAGALVCAAILLGAALPIVPVA